MKVIQVEHAVGMIRAQLIECAVQDDWSDDGVAKVIDAIRGCVQQIAAARGSGGLAVDRRLPRETLRRMVRFVNDHLDTKLRWDDIAAHVGMDRYVFGRRFKLSTGMTPHEYVVRSRLRRAMNLLARTDRSIADIALDVGCACQSHFTTMFRKCTGTTPGAFRSAAAGDIPNAPSFARFGRSAPRAPGRLPLALAARSTVHASLPRAELQVAEPALA